jgi:hypothetical protein
MSGFEIVAAIIAAFFTAGFVIGVLLVSVLPARRARPPADESARRGNRRR